MLVFDPMCVLCVCAPAPPVRVGQLEHEPLGTGTETCAMEIQKGREPASTLHMHMAR